MPFATSPDGTRLYFEEQGSGDALVLVNGQAMDHTGWDTVRGDFTDRYRVVVFDHRGTGASDKPAEPPYSVQGFAEDVVAILDHLGVERAHAYGISMGGRICQWLGIQHGRRVGALILGCTTPGNKHGVRRPPEVDARLANRPSDPAEALAFQLESMVSPEWAAAHPEYVSRVRDRVEHPIPAYAQRLHYLASEGHDSWDLLPSIKAPTLVIHGSDDVVNPTANAQLLADRIPGAELHLVASARHGFFVEFHEEAARVINAFLARHPF
ncbi:MAG: alpha/beta fold hydrolase [Chloroflexota bacterium]|nr:alpha/beta fold hydrolase [Chloroflexota bacterium]